MENHESSPVGDRVKNHRSSVELYAPKPAAFRTESSRHNSSGIFDVDCTSRTTAMRRKSTTKGVFGFVSQFVSIKFSALKLRIASAASRHCPSCAALPITALRVRGEAS